LGGTITTGLSYDINWRPRLTPPVSADRMGMLISYDFVEASFARDASTTFWGLVRCPPRAPPCVRSNTTHWWRLPSNHDRVP
jgi:hypothetical protein